MFLEEQVNDLAKKLLELKKALALLETKEYTQGGVGSYTTENAQDDVGGILVDSATINFTYDDATPSITAIVIDDSISDAKLRDSGALSVIGRSANSTGNPADISAVAASGAVLRESGSTIGFGTIATAGIGNDQVTYAKIQNVSATDRLLGRVSALAGDIEEIPITDFVQSILDDADAATVRSTLGLGTMALETATNYVKRDGTTTLTAEWDIGEDMSIRAERLEARDNEGLRLEDDGGNLGIFIEDGGQVGIWTASPDYPLRIEGDVSNPATQYVGIGGLSATTGYTLLALRDKTSANTNLPVLGIIQDNGSDDQAALYVRQDGSAAMMELEGESGSSPILVSTAGSATPGIIMRKANGTLAAKTQVLTDELMGFFGARGADGSSYSASTTGLFGLHAAEDFTGTNEGVYATVAVSPIGSQTRREITRFNSDGRVRIGPNTITPASPLHVYETTSSTGATTGITVEQGSTGDAEIQFLLTGGQRWVLGIDNSDSDNFGVSASADLANKIFKITTAGLVDIKAGTSTGMEARVGGVMYSAVVSGSNVGTGEDDLATYSVPANALANDGDSLRFEACGSCANTVATKRVRIRFGSSGTNLIFDTGTTLIGASADVEWVITGRITRYGAALQVGFAVFTASWTSHVVATGLESSLNQTLSGAVSLRVTGEATNNNDITCYSLFVSYHPANS